MNAIDLLKSQHHDIEALFEQVLSASTREMKERFLIRLADSLAIHASIEEHHLFPAAHGKQVTESIEEHLAIRSVLGDLMDAEVEDEAFNAKMAAVLETVEQHVHAEEENLFPKVKMAFDGLELEALGQAMGLEQAELEESGNAREALLRELDGGAPARTDRPC
jgi:hemerythrin superfamily protein